MSLKCARFLTTFFSHLPHHDRFLQIRSGFKTKHFVCTMLKNNFPTIVASDESAILRHVRNLVNFKEKKKKINKILFDSQYKTQFQYPSSITAIIIIKPINLTHSYAFKCLKTFDIFIYILVSYIAPMFHMHRFIYMPSWYYWNGQANRLKYLLAINWFPL